jgi:uncharacterized membrane protein
MMIATVATAAVGAYGQYQTGKAQNEMYKYEAAQGEADARAEQKSAVVESERIRKMGQRAAAEANVQLAANGGDLASAGSLAINREIYRSSEEDAYFALVGGEDRSKRMLAGAQLDKMRGSAAKTAGMFGAVQTLGSGAMTAMGNWKQAKG